MFIILFSLPWDCTTFIGYMGETIFQTVTGQCYLFSNGVVLLMFIAMYFHHHAFYQIFCEISENIDSANEEQKNKSIVCDLFRFHVLVKR